MLINMNEVCNLIEMDRVTIRSKMQDGIFPKIKGRCGNNQMWSLQDVRDWLKVFEWQVMNLTNDGISAWKIGRELRTSAERAQKTIDKFRNDCVILYINIINPDRWIYYSYIDWFIIYFYNRYVTTVFGCNICHVIN